MFHSRTESQSPATEPAGEFALIAHILRLMPVAAGLEVGPGDDAAVFVPPPGRPLVATTDMLVEGVHFDLAFSSPADVGFKAIAVNVSDVAAMGGIPRQVLLAVGLPVGGAGPAAGLAEGLSAAGLAEGLAEGIGEACREFGIGVAGGDTVGGDRMVVAVTLLGEEGPGGTVRRSGARSGHLLCVTGVLGAAAAGLALFRRGDDPKAADLAARFPGLLAAHRRGQARAAAGSAAAAAGASAMIDLSDGLASDAGHLAVASETGVEVEAHRLPLASGVADVARWLGEEPWRLALEGGDDYELAVAVPPDRLDELRAAVAPLPVTEVGRFGGAGARLLTPGGSTAQLRPSGWDHFREP